MKKKLESYDPRHFVIIKGARLHNLKGVDVAIPRKKLVVVTGVSGSGKSSLIFDTLFAEGQRRYVESLSSYARQFLTRMKKPEVDYIKGLSPAMAIEQKTASRNPRSTVGTSTEIYDYMKLLFARTGKTISPISGEEVQKDRIKVIVEDLTSLKSGKKVFILAPLVIHPERGLEKELDLLLQKGFTRVFSDNQIVRIEDSLESLREGDSEIEILIDRFISEKGNDEYISRIADSVQTALFEGQGHCRILLDDESQTYSDLFERDGMSFEEPSVDFFSFSNPYGACNRCEGFGTVLGIDENLVIPDKNLSIFEGAIACWRSEKMEYWHNTLIRNSEKFDFPIHKPYSELSEDSRALLWTGNEHFEGLNDFFQFLSTKKHKIQYRVMLSRFKGRTICPDCRGTRLRKDAGFVKIIHPKTKAQTSIIDAVLLPIVDLKASLDDFEFKGEDVKIADRLLREIHSRLDFLITVGLGYLTLNRRSNTLSGGEAQRIKLATSLGSSLVGSLYILDEPSIGLHPKDSENLVKVLKNLRDKGNTVIVVEHEEEVISEADEILDIGPFAGTLGGELVFQGTLKEMMTKSDTLTADYLNGTKLIEVPELRRPWSKKIVLEGASENNLKNINVSIPLYAFTCVSGVSGSGKTTLIKSTLYNALKRVLFGYGERSGQFSKITGDYKAIEDVELIDQNPIGRSSRSNPATYTKSYDQIRTLMSNQPLAKVRGYKPGVFSFNTKGGRCDVCEGEGVVKIDMQFLADIQLECESCKGRRFKEDVLEIEYRDKNISDILTLTVDDAMGFFENEKSIISRIKPLQDVGLGYVTLGQSSSTLSGGEAQRIKLASYLGKGSESRNKLFIFDEPTTGLHFDDIKKLLLALNALVDKGNTVIAIEHNIEVLKSADWLIDLGPDGGDRGGELLFQGVPEGIVDIKRSYTAGFLEAKLNTNA